MAKTAKFKVTTKKKVCYVIEIADSKTGEFFYKVGETAMDKEDRILALLNKYEGESRISARLLFTTPLPSKNGMYITDATTRNYLISNNKFSQVHPDRVKGMINGTDGYTEWLMLPNGRQIDSKELEVIVELAIDELAKIDGNFTGMLKLSYDPTQTHRVSYRMMREFDKVIVDENGKKCSIDDLVNKTGKTFLFIGQFLSDFIYSFALRNDVTIWHDNEEEKVNSEYLPLNEKIHYVADLKEIIAMGKKFDFIIANPPYSMGNDITNAVLHFVDFGAYVNLMPKKCYKGGLHAYIKDIDSACDYFEDATVGGVLTIATLSKNPINIFTDYDELEFLTFNKEFHKFYYNNEKRPCKGFTCTLLANRVKPWEKFNQDTDFFVYVRTPANGVDMSGGMYDWNNKLRPKDELKEYIIRNHPSEVSNANPLGEWLCGHLIMFDTPTQKSNFTDWYYRNGSKGLVEKLIKGLNRTSGAINPAVPRVDWSRPWTDEEILLDYGYTPEEIRKILA